MPRSMKDSGIEWVGQIPSGWSIKRIKYVLSHNDGGVWGDDPIDGLGNEIVLRSTEQTIDGKWIIQNPAERRITNPTPYRIKAGDLLVTKSSGSAAHIGKTTLATETEEKEKYLYSNFLQRLHTNTGMLPKYLWYLLNSPISREQFVWMQNSTIGIGNINAENINQVCIPYPEYIEQCYITTFLDSKCAEIDSLRADIEKEIEKLEEYKKSVITEAVTKGLDKNVPMKDSGIEWVGEIPAHWDVDKGKYCLRYVQKPTRPDDDVITCFRDGEVTLRKNRREEGFTISLKEIGYQGIDVGDLIVHGMDGFAGSIGISDSRGKASPVLNVLDTDHNKKYIMYYLRNMAYNGVFLALATGIRVRTCDTNWGKLRELPYTLPPKCEQDAIAEYIDSVLAAVEDLIKDKQAQLDTLADYKKSVIYEYVTGKKEVPAV